MNKVLEILSKGQEPNIKRLMFRRHSALMSNLRYLRETRSDQFLYVKNEGWDIEHFEILFALNTFYLLVLGPLASSARGRENTIWKDTAIQYGNEFLFDNKRAKEIRNAHQSFTQITRRIPGGLNTITGNQASDIIFKLHKAMQDEYTR